jgi:hypothetical protein
MVACQEIQSWDMKFVRGRIGHIVKSMIIFVWYDVGKDLMSPQNNLRSNYLRIYIKHHAQCLNVIFDMSGDQKLHCFCDNFDMKMGFISQT